MMLKPLPKFKIGSKVIGKNQRAYIIAEIGSNHNNDLNLAKKLIKEASNTGVDAVKFQTFKAKNHYSKFTPGFKYLKNYNTYKLIQSLEIKREWHPILKEYAEKNKVDFFSSPCDYEAVDQLNSIDVVAHKVASFDLSDLDLIKYISKSKKPIILSTGMSTMKEIERAIKICLKQGNNKIIILQCTSLYPAPINLSNVSSIGNIQHKFKVITGYSDHTQNNISCLASIVFGAKVIEKHFTLNRKLKGPDHAFATQPNELKKLVDEIRMTEDSIGDGKKNGPHKLEKEMYLKGRRSIHAACNIKKGQKIERKMLIIKRPNFGIDPFNINKILDKKAAINIKKDHWISWDMIN